MPDHDWRAELAGYRNERALHSGNPERAAAIDAEIDRVAAAIRAQADGLDRQADVHDATGQDVLAAQARVRARQLREGLPELAVAEGPDGPDGGEVGDVETAQSPDASPRPPSTPKRRRTT